MHLAWDESAWDDACKYWQTADRKILKHINTLIDACLRDPFSGIGKPEQVKCGVQDWLLARSGPTTGDGSVSCERALDRRW